MFLYLPTKTQMKQQHIIFLHALFFSPLVMKPMEKYLFRNYDNERTSYHQFKYKSRNYSEQTLSDLAKLIESIPTDEKIILIGHSLGGLVGRNYLDTYQPKRDISLITLGTPHNTSIVGKVANLISSSIIGSSANAGIVYPTKEWSGHYPLYCISGTLNIGPQVLLKESRNKIGDGTVLLDESFVPNCTEKYELKLSHTALIYSSKSYKLIIKILKNLINIDYLENFSN